MDHFYKNFPCASVASRFIGSIFPCSSVDFVAIKIYQASLFRNH